MGFEAQSIVVPPEPRNVDTRASGLAKLKHENSLNSLSRKLLPRLASNGLGYGDLEPKNRDPKVPRDFLRSSALADADDSNLAI
jgi:hypothetical protein